MTLALGTPRSVDHVSALVREAERTGRTVRAVGGRTSLSNVCGGAHISVPTTGLVGVRSVGRRLRPGVHRSALMEVGAGVVVRALQLELARRGRTLSNTAAFTEQTIVGAMATASHGTGLALPPMCDLLASVVVVTRGGRAVRVEASDGPTDRQQPGDLPLIVDDDLFHGIVTGLGSMGVVVAVTVRTVPMFDLVEERRWQPLDEVLDELVCTDLLERTRHVQVLANWRGVAGEPPMTVTTLRRTVARSRRRDRVRGRQRWLPLLAARLPTWRWLVPHLKRHPERIDRAIHTGLRSLVRAPVTGPAHRLLDNWPLNVCAPAWASEVFVPLDRWRRAVGDLLAVSARSTPLTGPFSIRFVGPSRHLLAPSHGRAGAMIEVVHLRGSAGGRDALAPYVHALTRHGGRMHLGLDLFDNPHADPAPDVVQWRAARQRFDPGPAFCVPRALDSLLSAAGGA